MKNSKWIGKARKIRVNIGNMVQAYHAKAMENLIRRSIFQPTTKQLVQEYLDTPTRRWKARKTLRDRIASSAILDVLEAQDSGKQRQKL